MRSLSVLVAALLVACVFGAIDTRNPVADILLTTANNVTTSAHSNQFYVLSTQVANTTNFLLTSFSLPNRVYTSARLAFTPAFTPGSSSPVIINVYNLTGVVQETPYTTFPVIGEVLGSTNVTLGVTPNPGTDLAVLSYINRAIARGQNTVAFAYQLVTPNSNVTIGSRELATSPSVLVLSFDGTDSPVPTQTPTPASTITTGPTVTRGPTSTPAATTTPVIATPTPTATSSASGKFVSLSVVAFAVMVLLL
ncbi:hypothetical protein AKO1_015123 [Acrasis kona]|uniref:Uncharacterized protein n=1 Tax=Acrasis kona TaxID=1008807 RepID=A0AAW2Z9P9_9EUKA